MDNFHHYLLKLYNIHKTINYRHFTELRISQGQPKVLELLLAHDGCSQKKLAKMCELQPATMSVLLKKMERDGLIHKVKDTLSSGIHIIRIFLTNVGREKAVLVLENVLKVEEKCFLGFNDNEKIRFLENMEKIYKNLES